MRQSKTYPEQHRTIGALLRAPYEHLQTRVYTDLASEGYPEIRQSHSVVFRYILNSGSSVSELAEKAGITKQSMAYLVDYLWHHDYVQMEPHPNDKRAKLVTLTAKGKEVQKAAVRLSRKVEKEWAKLIGEKEMSELRQFLDNLSEQIIQNSNS